jgi:hypothetical protein
LPGLAKFTLNYRNGTRPGDSPVTANLGIPLGYGVYKTYSRYFPEVKVAYIYGRADVGALASPGNDDGYTWPL